MPIQPPPDKVVNGTRIEVPSNSRTLTFFFFFFAILICSNSTIAVTLPRYHHPIYLKNTDSLNPHFSLSQSGLSRKLRVYTRARFVSGYFSTWILQHRLCSTACLSNCGPLVRVQG
uniref:Uncharacterized protein n=1 Tax=Salix viminalis TaxID=40686 RepID=A0A6N2KSH5_SALVM